MPYFTGEPVFYLSYLICSAIQLGATVDYAILFADRYKEAREFMLRRDAVVETVRVTTVPILTSGLVLTVVGFLLSALATHGIIAQLGWFLGVGTLLSLFGVLFALPGLLYVFDGAIEKVTLGTRFLRESGKEGVSHA